MFFRSFCSHFRPQRIFIFIFFRRLICRRQMIAKRPPHTFRRSCVPAPTSLLQPTLTFWLVVVSPGSMTATYGHGPIPLSLYFHRFNLTTEPTTWRQLLVGCCVLRFNGGHPDQGTIPLSLDFCRFNSMTEPMTRHPPTRFATAAHPP